MATKKQRRGRPPIRGEAGQRYQVTVPPRAAEIVRKQGKGSLSAGILWNPAVRREFDRERIIANEKRISKLETSNADHKRAAEEQVRRLRQENEELSAMLRWEVAWERQRNAFFALLPQFLPRGNGMPSIEAINEVDAANMELKAAQQEIDRIVREIQNGQRRRG